MATGTDLSFVVNVPTAVDLYDLSGEGSKFFITVNGKYGVGGDDFSCNMWPHTYSTYKIETIKRETAALRDSSFVYVSTVKDVSFDMSYVTGTLNACTKFNVNQGDKSVSCLPDTAVGTGISHELSDMIFYNLYDKAGGWYSKVKVSKRELKRGLYFPSKNATDYRVATGGSNLFGELVTSDKFTISFWIYPLDNTSQTFETYPTTGVNVCAGQIFDRGFKWNQAEYGIAIRYGGLTGWGKTNEKCITVLVGNGASNADGGQVHQTLTNSVPLNTLTHVAIIFDGSNKSIKIYLDGALNNGTGTVLSSIVTYYHSEFYLGGNNTSSSIVAYNSWGKKFHGYISDLYISSAVLTSGDITKMRNGDLTTSSGWNNSSSIIAHYPFTTNANCLISSGNNLTLGTDATIKIIQ